MCHVALAIAIRSILFDVMAAVLVPLLVSLNRGRRVMIDLDFSSRGAVGVSLIVFKGGRDGWHPFGHVHQTFPYELVVLYEDYD